MGAQSRQLALIAAVGFALALWARRADASIAPAGEPLPPDDGSEGPAGAWDGFFDPWGYVDPSQPEQTPLEPVITSEEDPMQPLRAALYMVRRAEHFPADVASGMDYLTFYGGSHFSDTSDHPVATGEKRGIPLPDEWCRKAGFRPGCVSTAAGAYQITLPTWRRLRSRRPYITDFGPASQDEAALRLIIESGADRLLQLGDVEGAIGRMSSIWASLAGSRSGQPQKSMTQLLAYYSTGLSMA